MGENKLHIKLPSKIITKLGGALYGGFIPAICETISNSYDADATLVTIQIDENEVCIEDNGIGMSWETLKNSFFEAGNNRRTAENQGKTNKGRMVTGKKGLGKFALFGLCEEIYIETCDGKNINTFLINIEDLNKSNATEYPLDPIKYNEKSPDGKSYTKIVLKKLLKKFRGSASIDSLARRINYVFKNEKDEFLIKLKWMKDNKEEILDKEKRLSIVKGEQDNDQRIIYEIPESLSTMYEKNKIKLDQSDIDYIMANNIRGFLVARKQTTKIAEQKGLAIFSRGKICQDPSYFDIQQTNSFGYAHLYGELEIDFIDADDNDDNISTNRKEIEWDKNEKLEKLRELINKLLKRYADAYDNDKKILDQQELEAKAKLLDIDIKWFEKYKELDEQNKQQLSFLTNAVLKFKNNDFSDEKNKKMIQDVVSLLENGIKNKLLFINSSYIEPILSKFSEIKRFYDEAIALLLINDIESVLIKANAMREEVIRQQPNVYKIFTNVITNYPKSIEKQEARGAVLSLLKPLQSFSQSKDNAIESLRSSTQTAHNTAKNPQNLNDLYLAELVLNYVFMYAGFVLRNPELFSQSPDSSKEEQHSQSDEQ